MSAKRRRCILVRPQGQHNSEINVTPLVDVVLVLLIIFMVVSPMMEKNIPLQLPATEAVVGLSENQAAQIVVSVSADGELAINSEKIAAENYVEQLGRFIGAREAGDRVVFFLSSDKARYSEVVFALEGARRAGAEVLGMTTSAEAESSPE